MSISKYNGLKNTILSSNNNSNKFYKRISMNIKFEHDLLTRNYDYKGLEQEINQLNNELYSILLEYTNEKDEEISLRNKLNNIETEFNSEKEQEYNFKLLENFKDKIEKSIMFVDLTEKKKLLIVEKLNKII
jgi:hypothetical protein